MKTEAKHRNIVRYLPAFVPGVALVFPILILGLFPVALGSLEEVPTQAAPKSGDSSLALNPDGYTSARVCGKCHVDIYKSWKNSLHAFSLTDPIFDAAFMQAVKSNGDEAREICLRCHAPMTQVTGDFMLRDGLSHEGVSCDFCHTVTAVHLDRPEAPYSISLDGVKRSIIKKAASPAHEVAYSELHGRSEFCGGCHNYINPQGAAIFSTYDEWREGPYSSEGVQCQDCHMVLSKGLVVSQKIKQSSSQIHLHSLIHDREQLRDALAVRINRVDRRADSLSVEVEVENVGSGHKVPTGLPSRVVALIVTAKVGESKHEDRRRYTKVIGDARNRTIENDHAMILDGVRVLRDNRIGPREKRIEQFQFHGRPSGEIQVVARLVYQYKPTILGIQNMSIDLGQAERVVP